MKYRSQSAAPEDDKVDMSVVSAQPWFRALVSNVAPMQKVPEGCLVGVGCSRLWDNPKSVPVVAEGDKASATGNFYNITLATRKAEWKLKTRALKAGEKDVFETFAANFYFPKQESAVSGVGGSSSAAAGGAGTIVNLVAKPVTLVDERGHVTFVLSSEESLGSSDDNAPSPPSAGGKDGDQAIALALESFSRKKISVTGGDEAGGVVSGGTVGVSPPLVSV